MELFRAKYGSKVRVLENPGIPPDSIEVKEGDIITLIRLDGMYCKCKNSDGDFVYVTAWTEVEQLKQK